jgi:hypothetical protein
MKENIMADRGMTIKMNASRLPRSWEKYFWPQASSIRDPGCWKIRVASIIKTRNIVRGFTKIEVKISIARVSIYTLHRSMAVQRVCLVARD